jgi:hypothetical protein
MRHLPAARDLRPPLLAVLALVVGLRAGEAVPVALPLPPSLGQAPAPTVSTGALAHATFAVG